MKRGEPSRKKRREGERRFEARRHDSARVLEGTEDPRAVADPVVAGVAAEGHDVRERRYERRPGPPSTTTEGRR